MNAEPTLAELRFNMIEQQIRPWDVLDEPILQLLAQIRREEFVPPRHRALAFVDMMLPLRGERDEALRLGQVMLEPKVEARLVQDVKLQGHEKVLEVGAGSGYMAALLAARAQRVITLEIEPELARMARENLQRAGVRNCEVREADGSRGLAAEGPFDVILLSGSVAEVPQALLQQLKPGGRLATITGDEPVMRATIITRTGDATFTTAQPWDTLAPRLLNFPEPSRFKF
ncbi:protein-L-isoaspartate O-methyltransferase [Ramlibacter tataouinensis]|uniref:protein-L-isoaspartate O-methyltransferase family protein n=1 Tax=Ramlibacter tataouinensis TaxID=94132 RepID=UPI0022F3ACA5|nr:protein-L-isoaspartate O-methyltransferase [Ramlibacter tataouinensis]WBY01310.1 protein-L-isoaspartate O-methyltransferase [Ramlibacter tataouinensis]